MKEGRKGTKEATVSQVWVRKGHHYKRVNPFIYLSEAGQRGVQVDDPVCPKCLPQWFSALTISLFVEKKMQ